MSTIIIQPVTEREELQATRKLLHEALRVLECVPAKLAYVPPSMSDVIERGKVCLCVTDLWEEFRP